MRWNEPSSQNMFTLKGKIQNINIEIQNIEDRNIEEYNKKIQKKGKEL